ncbi:DUF29 family protein [Argonema antarcticum]|uniref:DUF29 family protein n=1 Tax=Argonema antarcticum TaxID=2942763 RepID=UPI002012CE50|nr:DUF29 family protein [Argonema antarcticum]MCL1474573.1 DUF29 domain-containing protein [Argonema antarcticum A004/B2]
MTQELIDLRISILEGRYSDALAIVDDLEGMSKKEILRKIKAFLRVLVIHLIKNQVEQRLTNSWAASIRNSLREIQDVNQKENRTSYYVNSDEWEDLIEEEILENAIADASEEVMNGKYTRSQLSEMLDKPQLLQITTRLLNLTYTHSAKELPALIEEHLVQLPGGQDWIDRRK